LLAIEKAPSVGLATHAAATASHIHGVKRDHRRSGSANAHGSQEREDTAGNNVSAERAHGAAVSRADQTWVPAAETGSAALAAGSPSTKDVPDDQRKDDGGGEKYRQSNWREPRH
jgi:hypothetical protein